jgi:hypothetical protein
MRKQVFISYSHRDRQWLEQLQEHLKPLEREGKVARWDDTKIDPGGKWKEEIERALTSTRVAVLLVSAAFLASDFIADNELPPLLEAAERGGAVILSVLVSPSRYKQTTNISQFQAINEPSKTLVEMTEGERARVWVRLTEVIEAALDVKPQQNPVEHDEPPGKVSSPTPKVQPMRPAEGGETGIEVTMLEEAEIKNTRAGNVTGVASDDTSIASDLEAKVNLLNKSKIENSVLGDFSGVTLKGGKNTSE